LFTANGLNWQSAVQLIVLFRPVPQQGPQIWPPRAGQAALPWAEQSEQGAFIKTFQFYLKSIPLAYKFLVVIFHYHINSLKGEPLWPLQKKSLKRK
jgi:hypothetical protein